jgi:3-dehydroquinate dehydratase-2
MPKKVRRAIKWRILLVQGVNMVHLGTREPEIYGTTTATELDAMLQEHAKTNDYSLDIFYTNVEGEAINRIYQATDSGVHGLVMNPAGFNYAGYALRDCVTGAGLPYVEVHMTNIQKRGIPCVLATVAAGVISGFGVDSYVLGLDAILNILATREQKS